MDNSDRFNLEKINKLLLFYILLHLIIQSCESKKEKDAVKLIQDRIENVISQTTPSVVTIFRKQDKEKSLLLKDIDDESVGSGFVIKKTSNYLYIATNAHVIEKKGSIFVRFYNDRVFKAEVVGVDTKTDIAVLKVKLNNFNRDIKSLKFEYMENVKPGMFVLVAGSPYNLGHTYTFGIISAINREVGISSIEGFIQTDASINPGDSGGPLLNLDGKVVGMSIATVQTGQGIGFAIPVDILQDTVNQLIKYGKVRRGWIGIVVTDVSEEIKERMNIDGGALVLKIEKKSPASGTGLIVGDIITKINGNPIKNSKEFRIFLNKVKPGDMIELEIINSKGKRTVTVIPIEKD